MLRQPASDWWDRLRAAMTAPNDEVVQRQIFLDWVCLLGGDDRLSLAQAITDHEAGWLSAAGRGANPVTEPRALDAVARVSGFDLHLTDGRVCRVPWHISTALEAAEDEARAAMELLDDGRIISWPMTGDEQRVASLAAVYAKHSPSTPR